MRHFAAHVGVSLFFPFSPKNIYLKADTTVAGRRSKAPHRMNVNRNTRMQKKEKKKEKKEKEDARQFRVWVLLPFFGMHLSLELR